MIIRAPEEGPGGKELNVAVVEARVGNNAVHPISKHTFKLEHALIHKGEGFYLLQGIIVPGAVKLRRNFYGSLARLRCTSDIVLLTCVHGGYLFRGFGSGRYSST
jgi:hypothetical protein